jgi:hypothetical protein
MIAEGAVFEELATGRRGRVRAIESSGIFGVIAELEDEAGARWKVHGIHLLRRYREIDDGCDGLRAWAALHGFVWRENDASSTAI